MPEITEKTSQSGPRHTSQANNRQRGGSSGGGGGGGGFYNYGGGSYRTGGSNSYRPTRYYSPQNSRGRGASGRGGPPRPGKPPESKETLGEQQEQRDTVPGAEPEKRVTPAAASPAAASNPPLLAAKFSGFGEPVRQSHPPQQDSGASSQGQEESSKRTEMANVPSAPGMPLPAAWQQQQMMASLQWAAYQQQQQQMAQFQQLYMRQLQVQQQQQHQQHLQQQHPVQSSDVNGAEQEDEEVKSESDGGGSQFVVANHAQPPPLHSRDEDEETGLAQQLEDLIKDRGAHGDENPQKDFSAQPMYRDQGAHAATHFNPSERAGGDQSSFLPRSDAQTSSQLEYRSFSSNHPSHSYHQYQQHYPWMTEALDSHEHAELPAFSPIGTDSEHEEDEISPSEPRRPKTRSQQRQVALEVGGRMFYVFPSTFQAYPDSRLNRVLNGAKPVKLNDHHAIPFDRDGFLFDCLLSFCRTGRLTIPPGVSVAAVLDEAQYFGLLSYMKNPNRPRPDRFRLQFGRERRRRLCTRTPDAYGSANTTCVFVLRDDDKLILKEVVALSGDQFVLLVDVFKEIDGTEVNPNCLVYDSMSPPRRSRVFSSGYMYRFKLRSVPENSQQSVAAECVFEEEFTFSDNSQIIPGVA